MIGGSIHTSYAGFSLNTNIGIVSGSSRQVRCYRFLPSNTTVQLSEQT